MGVFVAARNAPGDLRQLPFHSGYASLSTAVIRSRSSLLGNVCFSRKLYDEVGGYDEKVGMAEDLDLYVRFLIHGHLNVYLPMISHLHRMHTANFSIGCDRDKHHSDLTDIYKRNENKLKIMGVKLTLSN